MTDRPCSKCGQPTLQRTSDDVGGAVGIPLCASCSRNNLKHLLILLLTLALVAAYVI